MGSSGCTVAWVDAETAFEGRGVAAEHTAQTFEDALSLVAALASGEHGEGPWFGGVGFPGASWRGFPAARFVRPVELERRPRETWTAAARPAFTASVMPEQWAALIGGIRTAVGEGRVQKVVAARTLELEAPGGLDAEAVHRALCATAPAPRHFLFRGTDGSCFFGATPETLVRWRSNRVDIDALAGTVPVGGSFSEKERREHAFVVADVTRALEPLPVLRPAEPAVMKLPNVWHLHTRVSARTDERFGLGALLRRLFPTSAVAGTPRRAALELLSAHEGFTRGWYAGAVGRIAPGDVDLAVALRCGLIEAQKATLFAGAGIVAGSDAQSEWDETERKLQPALNAVRTVMEAARARR
jgi:isochorismate synthase